MTMPYLNKFGLQSQCSGGTTTVLHDTKSRFSGTLLKQFVYTNEYPQFRNH